jgi:hypothetical protein
MAKRKRQMAKLRSRERFLPFDFCHLNFDLLVFAGGGSETLPCGGRDARSTAYVRILLKIASGIDCTMSMMKRQYHGR